MGNNLSNRDCDILRNVVIGRVTDDGSCTEVGKFSDVKAVTFQGEEMPDEFKTRYLRLRNEVLFTAEIEPTIAKRFADEIYKEIITPFLLQMAEQLGQTQELCVCYANPDDHDVIEFIKSAYATMQLRILNDVVYTKMVKKGMIYLVPVSKVYKASPLLDIQATPTGIDKLSTEKPPVRDISRIRKQMKHCKNPMERKALERELNAAFKEKKRRKK